MGGQIIVVYLYHGKLHNREKEQTTDLYNNMNESCRHNITQKKPDPKHIQYE